MSDLYTIPGHNFIARHSDPEQRAGSESLYLHLLPRPPLLLRVNLKRRFRRPQPQQFHVHRVFARLAQVIERRQIILLYVFRSGSNVRSRVRSADDRMLASVYPTCDLPLEERHRRFTVFTINVYSIILKC